MNFGFLEYETVSDAITVLRSGLHLASKVVKLSFIHAGVFVPVYVPSAFSVIINKRNVRYWDEQLYIAEYPDSRADTISAEVAMVTPSASATEVSNNVTKHKIRHAPSTTPLPPQVQKWQLQQLAVVPPSKSISQASARMYDGSRSFADFSRLACLLCNRKFGTVSEIQKHETLSSLHDENLLDPKKCNRALWRISKLQKINSKGAT